MEIGRRRSSQGFFARSSSICSRRGLFFASMQQLLASSSFVRVQKLFFDLVHEALGNRDALYLHMEDSIEKRVLSILEKLDLGKGALNLKEAGKKVKETIPAMAQEMNADMERV